MGKIAVAWILLVAGLILSLAAANFVRMVLMSEEGDKLAHAADQIQLKTRERLASHELILRGGAGLFAASAGVSRAEWKAYIDTLRPDDIVPGVQGIGFSQLIPKQELDTHIARIRAEGFPAYMVTPAGDRDVYSSAIYLEPFSDHNLLAFGYDMFSEPVRRAAMIQARDTGNTALSGKVKLVQETEGTTQAGALMYAPVYRQGLATDTVKQRQRALIGWTYSPFRINDLMINALQEWKNQLGTNLQLTIYDGTDFKPEALLYSTSSKLSRHVDHPFHQHRIIDFNGHQWLMALDHTPIKSELGYLQAWLTLAGGFVISGLLFWLLNSLALTNLNAKRIAERLTANLREKDHQLNESEYRWKFALEGSDLGVWDWNLADNTVFFSKRWKEMLGFSENEISSHLDEWSKLVHPDDLQGVLDMIRAYLDGKLPNYDCEHRILCKDGNYKWICDRGIVVNRDASGKPLRMIGTHADITERKCAEQALISSRELLQSIVENVPIRIFWKDAELRYLGCNSLFSRDAGIASPEDMVGKDDFQLPWRDRAELYRTDDQQVMDSGTPKLRYEEPQTAADGSTIWLRVSKMPLREKGGRVFGVLGVYEDVTNDKQRLLDIQQLTSLYAGLSECNDAVIHCETLEDLLRRVCQLVVKRAGVDMAWVGITDAAGNIVPAASDGQGLEYLDGIRITVHAEDPSGRGPTGTATRENRSVWLDDFRTSTITAPWQHHGSPYGWLSSAALPISRGGQTVGALSFYSRQAGGWHNKELRDLLEKMASTISFALDKFAAADKARAAETTLLDSEQRFRTMVEQSIAGTFIIRDDRFVYVNPRMEQILGYPVGDGLVDQSPLSIVAAKDQRMAEQQLRDLLDNEARSTHFTFTALRRDGNPIEVGVSLAKAKYQQQPALIGLMQDITDRKVAEDQIRRYAKQLEHAFLQMVTLATTLSEMRDAYTVGHEKRVAEIAVAIGRELGLDAARLEGVRVGGYLHDVGKVCIPSEILVKPSRLSPNEFELIKSHSQAGYDVLKDIEFPWPVAQIALQHHERLDGSGYPNGLKGDQIILEARIVAIADVVESMGSHRPYRVALGIDKALAEIERGSGSLYDPQIASVCLRLFREKHYQLPT